MKNPAPLLERPKNLKVFAELFPKKRLAEGTHPPRPSTDKSKFKTQNNRKDNRTMEKVYTKNAPDAIGPYSQAVKVGNLVFTSGQIAIFGLFICCLFRTSTLL